MDYELNKLGFVRIPEFFSKEEVEAMRQLALNYFEQGNGFSSDGGKAKPDWIKDEKLQELFEIVSKKDIESTVSELVGEEVSFVGHNDLHLNRTVGWHKDRLNGDVRKYETHEPWDTVEDQTMKIFKVNIYLQDHTKNDDALTVRVGSHRYPEMHRGTVQTLKPACGDILIFDQRISHCARWSGGYNRLLICMGYGVRNCFFDEFKKGTEVRQDSQNSRSKR